MYMTIKRIVLMAAIALGLAMASCGTPDKEAIKTKIKEHQELTQSDYKDMIKLMSLDAKEMKRISEEADKLEGDAKKEKIKESYPLLEDFFVMGAELDKADKEGKLDKGNAERFHALAGELETMNK